MLSFKATKDRRVFLNDFEVPRCMEFAVKVEAGEDPEVVLRVSCDSVRIEDYVVSAKQTELQT